MRLIKARVQGYRSILDSGYFDVENGKTILVGPNEAGKTALLQALQKLNPPAGVELFDPLRDYPRARYDEDIIKKQIDPSRFTVVEGHFALEEDDKLDIPEAYHNAVFGWDATEVAEKQPKRPIVEIFTSVVKNDFSKFKLAKAFIRWTREHSLADLTTNEITCAESLISKVNKAIS